jgi:hypothetical protein
MLGKNDVAELPLNRTTYSPRNEILSFSFDETKKSCSPIEKN